jgi:putative ABC transport system permease protein
MTGGTLLFRSLRHYRRTNLAVLLGVAVATAILTGALLVGDSVNFSLQKLIQVRLGDTQLALMGQDRFFRSRLADDLENKLSANIAGVLNLRGILSNGDPNARVEVLGVDDKFWQLGRAKNPFSKNKDNPTANTDEIVLNEQLAQRLMAQPGDEVLLRVSKPSFLPRDAPLSLDRDFAVTARLTVRAVVGDEELGRFNLRTNQTAPQNAFVPREWLADKVGLTGKANLLLIGSNKQIDVETAHTALNTAWQIEDAGLQLRELPHRGALELRSNRIFMEESISQAARQADPNAFRILTYFVNELRFGARTTPYSIVSALDKKPGGIIEPAMSDDEIIINTWLAQDLQVAPGDLLDLKYYVIGPLRKLEEKTSTFRLRRIVPISGPAYDPNLMPAYPGLTDSDNCRDWEPGIAIDLNRIRDKDETYWDKYRGTPKAFITLNAGQKMWASRFGNLTAVRYPLNSISRQKISVALTQKLNPTDVGLFFQPVNERGQAAAADAIDLGSLFLGMSFFLIIAALGLTGLLFVFGVEHRHKETATLLAVGYSRQQVRWLFLMEGIILAGLGAILGTVASVIYTRAMIYGLSTAWASAAGGSTIFFHAKISTLLTGMAAGIVTATLAIWITLWRQKKLQVRELFSAATPGNTIQPRTATRKNKIALGFALAALTGAALFIILTDTSSNADSSGAFFGSGALLLVALLAACYTFFSSTAARSQRANLTFTGFAARNTTRRRGRSLTVVGLLACGSFLVFAVGANRHNPLAQAHKRDSGTGGFAFIGESALPILNDLNTPSGRKSLGLDDNDLLNVKTVHLRVRDGDDASCLNLNRAQQPRILGVQPNEFIQRQAFSFTPTSQDNSPDNPWTLLTSKETDNVIPAITDYNTIVWALGKKPGDTLDYLDERGQKFKIRLVAALQNSILQGSLIIAEDEFVQRFPSEQGYRMLLIDAPAQNQENVAKTFTRAGRNIGLDLTPAPLRLAELFAVENTYLSIFQLLGGLGMILGSVGLALVVLRNVMERRSEIAMLRAVGFDKDKLTRLIIHEHFWLLALGLLGGVLSALVAVTPALRTGGRHIPYLSLGLTLTALLISGLLWIWLAAKLSLRSPLLPALRNE